MTVYHLDGRKKSGIIDLNREDIDFEYPNA
jgi:hypothetical protein